MENYDRRELQNIDPFIATDLKLMEMAPNYNNWLRRLVQPNIGRRVLEIGPGIGTFSKSLIQNVDLLVGVEPNPYCVNYLNQALGNYPNFHLIQSNLEECDYQTLRAFKFDTVLCINVLEHIRDDISMLNLFESLLEPGGRVVLFVPAIPQAYGPIDKAVGHFRRYTRSSMKQTFSKTSMDIEKMFYSNFIGLIGWMYNARVKKLIRQNEKQIMLFNKFVPIISAFERVFGCPIGQSLVCVARVTKQ